MILVIAWINSQGQQNTLNLSVANMNKSNLLYFLYGLGSVRRMIASQNGSINIPTYCWWLKFCTTWDVWDPINNGKKLPTSTGERRISAINGMTVWPWICWWCDLLFWPEIQHTPGTYPRFPTNSLWRNSFHLGVWGCLGYATFGVCWNILRQFDSGNFSIHPIRIDVMVQRHVTLWGWIFSLRWTRNYPLYIRS